MPQLWKYDDKAWQHLPLNEGALSAAGAASRVYLRSAGGHWVLLAGAGADVRINGLRVPGRIRVLDDRDEILAGTERFYFSREALAKIEPHAAASVMCPRCKQPVNEGDLSVRCPGCGAVHHRSDDYPCWTYAPACSLCPQPTAIDAGFQWTPEEM